MIKISTQSLSIPLRTSFKHNTAERKVTDTVLVMAERSGLRGVGESCPRKYVTGESVLGAISWIERHAEEFSKLADLSDLENWERNNISNVDKNTAAYCAVELSLLDLFAKEKNESVERLLGIPEIQGPFQYSAVVSDESGEKLEKILQTYLKMGFVDFKFKLSGDPALDREKFASLESFAGPSKDKLRVRVDANNIWPGRSDEAIRYLKSMDRRFFGIEEPLGPHEWEGLSKMSCALDTAIILDESLLTPADMIRATQLPGRWIPNIRVSKVGGIRRALRIAEIASQAHCSIIIGAQVGETSILSRAALSIAQAYKQDVVAQEGAYGSLLLERDIAEPELRFGAAGLLQWESKANGFGLKICNLNA